MEDHEAQNHEPESRDTAIVARPQTGIERRGFGSSEMERRGETRSTDLAERAKAEVQARYIIAIQRPRSWDEVWAKLIKESKRPSFAEAALYRIKRGSKKDEKNQWVDNWIVGLSIGFARAALRAMTNCTLDEVMTYEDDWKQIWRVTAMDLESNVTSSKDVTIQRVIERSKANKYQEVIGHRQNAEGNMTYLIRATDDDMVTKVGAALSKARRNLILELLPADIADDCKATILGTRQNADKTDPETAKKKLIAAFGEIGVKVPQLEEYLGHALDAVQPAELETMRGIYQAVRDGETTWLAEMAERLDSAAAPDDAKSKSAVAKVREKLKDKQAAKAAAAKPATNTDAKPGDPTEEERREIEAQERGEKSQ